jgi:hypothetical protein
MILGDSVPFYRADCLRAIKCSFLGRSRQHEDRLHDAVKVRPVASSLRIILTPQ